MKFQSERDCHTLKEDSVHSEIFPIVFIYFNKGMLLSLLTLFIKSGYDFGKIHTAFPKIILKARSKHLHNFKTVFQQTSFFLLLLK